MSFCSEVILRAVTLATLTGAVIQGEVVPKETPAPRAVSVVRADSRTGRLVRTIVVKAKPPAEADQDQPPAGLMGQAGGLSYSSSVRTLVEETAKNHNVSPLLVDSVIRVESNYNPYAISPKGAQGLMQLMPATARRFGVTNSFDAKENIEGGVRYLKFLQDTFKDDRLAIAAYNAGEGAVTKYRDVPPYAETQSYVEKVGAKLDKAKRASVKSVKEVVQAKASEEPAAGVEEIRHVVQFTDAAGRLHLATR